MMASGSRHSACVGAGPAWVHCNPRQQGDYTCLNSPKGFVPQVDNKCFTLEPRGQIHVQEQGALNALRCPLATRQRN
jgi:hypothetical protein